MNAFLLRICARGCLALSEKICISRGVNFSLGSDMRLALFALLFFTLSVEAAVLPEERVDLLYHRYDGGGVVVDGPSVLVRKNIGDSVSVGVNYYVDNVTSASIDVVVSGASEYTEQRDEYSVNVDYLRQKTTMSVGYTNSDESDYLAETYSVGISQDMFGDLTTVSMGFAYGDNTVEDNTEPDFSEGVEVRSYRIGLSQILTKSLIMAFAFETISDEGYLNNPYRSVRYVSGSPVGYSFQEEVYPRTRTSNAVALRGSYYLPQRAAVHAGVRYFEDNWGIEATTYELGYTMPYAESWIFEGRFRYHDQGKADFYSDLFPFFNAQNYLARDKELSEFTSTTLGAGASYEFGRSWSKIDRGSLNAQVDWIYFDYNDFRDLTESGPVGDEPLYDFDAWVTRLFLSIWF